MVPILFFQSASLSTVVIIYLMYFLVNGERGILKYFQLKNLNQSYKLEYSKLQEENYFYLDRIKRLQPNTIDLDYLDEIYRKITGFSDENQTVIIME